MFYVRIFIHAIYIGKTMSVTVKTEEINDEEKSLTMRVVGGDILQLYSSFATKINVTDGFVNWTLEFEKINDSAPNPENYAKLDTQITKLLNLYLLNN